MAKRAWWYYIPHFAGALAVLWLFYRLRTALAPFVIAYLLAALLDPQVRRMEERGWKRRRAVAAIFIVFLFFFLGVLFTIVPVAVSEIRQISGQVSTYVEQLQKRALERQEATSALEGPPPVPNKPVPGAATGPPLTTPPEGSGIKLPAVLEEILHYFQVPAYLRELVARHAGDVYAAVARRVGVWAQAVLGSVGFLLWLLIIPIATFYLLNDLPRVRRGLLVLVPQKNRATAQSVLQDVGEVFLNYLRGLALVSALYGLAIFLVLFLIGVPYAVALAILAGILYPVPYLGPLITVATIFIVACLSLGWSLGALGGGMALATNQVFDQWLTPRLVGRSVGLHPVLTMLALLAGAELLGLLGMILAVPVAGAIRAIVLRLMPWLQSDAVAASAEHEKPKESTPHGVG